MRGATHRQELANSMAMLKTRYETFLAEIREMDPEQNIPDAQFAVDAPNDIDEIMDMEGIEEEEPVIQHIPGGSSRSGSPKGSRSGSPKGSQRGSPRGSPKRSASGSPKVVAKRELGDDEEDDLLADVDI